MILRLAVGALLAALVAGLAERAGSLSRSGRWAAVCVGALATAAGWRWSALLIAWFVASSLLTRLGRGAKTARTAGAVEESGARSALQVLANGSVFALAAVGYTRTGEASFAAAALGALAAATADTWATELGTLWGGAPRSSLSGVPVAKGMAGGVTIVGLLASLAGAALIALAGTAFVAPDLMHWDRIALAGVAGALADSVLGAAAQHKRRCARCDALTERRVHDCGTPTVAARGLPWMTNDTVNLLATGIGALVAVLASPR